MSSIFSSDLTAVITNVGVFLVAAAATGSAIWKTLKTIKANDDQTTPTKVLGASIIETTTMLMWSESNRSVCESNRELRDAVVALKHEMELARLTGRNRDDNQR